MPPPVASVSGGAMTGTCGAGATSGTARRRGQPGRQRQHRQGGKAAGRARERPAGGDAALLVARAERPARPREQHLDRSRRDLQAPGHLGERKPVHVLEQERGALPRGQIADGRFEESLQLGLLEEVVRRHDLAPGRRHQRSPRRAAEVVVAPVERQPVEPGTQADLAVPGEPFERADEHVLGDVLRVGRVPDDAQGEAVDACRVPLMQAANAAGVPRRNPSTIRASLDPRSSSCRAVLQTLPTTLPSPLRRGRRPTTRLDSTPPAAQTLTPATAPGLHPLGFAVPTRSSLRTIEQYADPGRDQ